MFHKLKLSIYELKFIFNSQGLINKKRYLQEITMKKCLTPNTLVNVYLGRIIYRRMDELLYNLMLMIRRAYYLDNSIVNRYIKFYNNEQNYNINKNYKHFINMKKLSTDSLYNFNSSKAEYIIKIIYKFGVIYKKMQSRRTWLEHKVIDVRIQNKEYGQKFQIVWTFLLWVLYIGSRFLINSLFFTIQIHNAKRVIYFFKKGREITGAFTTPEQMRKAPLTLSPSIVRAVLIFIFITTKTIKIFIKSMYQIMLNIKQTFFYSQVYNMFMLTLPQISTRLFYLVRKYLYTINHKKIALNYFYFCLWAGLSGGFLALLIRLELSHPGSSFFKGNMLLYLQTITSHGLIMVFFVVVPLIFGFFGNFLLPLHIGSKDVAFPRLNSIGFWVLPVGYLIVVRAGFLRPQLWKRRSYSSKAWFDLKTYNTDLKFESRSSLNQLVAPTINTEVRESIEDSTINERFISTTNLTEATILGKEQLANNHVKNHSHYITSDICESQVSYNNQGQLTDESALISYKMLPQFTHYYIENLWSNTLKNLWIGKRGSKKSKNTYVWKQYIEKGCGNTKVTTGWTFISPFTSQTKWSAKGAIDCLLIAVIFAGISTTFTFTNLLVTRRTMAMPGLESRRFLMPFLTIAILLVLRFLAVITPVLGSCVLMMYTDRHWGTTFFDFSYGGDPILSQHLFWFFGHPEVYVLIIPTFGIINMIIPYTAYRRVASKQHMIWAIYAMGIMGFLVWGHHMYLVGLDHKSRTIYSTITIMISLPATIKIVSWTLSALNSPLKASYLTFATLSYVLFFLVSGLTGMWLSHVCLNTSMHDTYYVIAHFHLMLSATTLIGLFIGVYYYFTTFFGVQLSSTFVWFHLLNYSLGQWLTFLPQFYLGTSGMPRRIHDYPDVFAGWNGLSTAGYFVTLTGVLGFFLVLADSNFQLKIATITNLLPRINNRATYMGLLLSEKVILDIQRKIPTLEKKGKGVLEKKNELKQQDLFTGRVFKEVTFNRSQQLFSHKGLNIYFETSKRTALNSFFYNPEAYDEQKIHKKNLWYTNSISGYYIYSKLYIKLLYLIAEYSTRIHSKDSKILDTAFYDQINYDNKPLKNWDIKATNLTVDELLLLYFQLRFNKLSRLTPRLFSLVKIYVIKIQQVWAKS